MDGESEVSILRPGFLSNLLNDLGKVTDFLSLSLPSTTQLTSETYSSFKLIQALNRVTTVLGFSFSLG